MELKPSIEVSYVGTALALAQEGLGIAIVPGYAWTLVDSDKAAWKRLIQPQVDREVTLVHLAHRPLTPAAAALADFLVRYAKRQGTAASESAVSRKSGS